MILRIILTVLGIAVLAVAALVVLLTVFPLRVTFEYKEPGLLIQLRVGPLRFTLLRRETPEQREERKRKKEEKKAKEAGKKPKKPEEPSDPSKKKERRRFLIKLVRRVLEELSRRGKIPLDKLWLDVTFGGEDPASAAMLFGGAQAGLGILWPVVEHYFSVGDRRIRTAVDFNLPATRVDYFCAVLPIPLAWGLSVAIRLLVWMVKERRNSETPNAKDTPTTSEQKEAV